MLLQAIPDVDAFLELYRNIAAIAALILLLAFLYSNRRSEEFRRLTNRLRTLHRTAQITSSALDTERVISQTVGAMHEIMGYSHVTAMNIVNGRLAVAAWAGYPQQPPDLDIHQGIQGRVARTGRPAFAPKVSADPDFVPTVPGTTSQIVLPVVLDGQPAGVLSVETVRGKQLTQQDFDLVESLAAGLGIALSNATRYERTREQAIRDGLTGLYNHAYFQERLREEHARARRYQRPLSLIIADIDDFKKINDRYGHTEGDRFLRLFAIVIKEQMREVDLPARYGGEEFAVIVPEASRKEAAMVAERLRAALAARALEVNGNHISVTASFGVAASPDDAHDPVELIRTADEALYAAKHAGKNQVRLAGEVAQQIAPGQP